MCSIQDLIPRLACQGRIQRSHVLSGKQEVTHNQLYDFIQPERHDIQGGHEDKHMKVGHKLWELGVLELTDVSCKGVEVLGQRYMKEKSLKENSPVCSTQGVGFQQGKDSCQQEVW